MKFLFDYHKIGAQAHTSGQTITIHLQECYNHSDLLSVLSHEALHAVINQIHHTTGKQDHYVMKALEVEWHNDNSRHKGD